MNKKFSLVLCALLLTLPLFPVFAEEQETEILLLEIVNGSIINGDNPLDSPWQTGSEPTRPTDFHAFIDGRTLTVTSEAPMPARLRVYNLNTSQLVVNRYFMVSDSQLLPSAGTYQIQIHIGRLTLTAEFEVE